MKQLIALTFVLFTLIGCKSNAEDATEDAVTEIANEDYYNCTDFFLSGNYTTFCTVETAIANISDSTIDGGGTVCKFIIPPINSETEVQTGVQFTSLQTSAQGQAYYDSSKKRSETAAVDNPKIFHTEISIDDYEGYVSEGRFANYSKSISVRYKNVLVTIAVIYYKEWFPVTTPCNYETDQLTELMKVVLENM